MRHPISTFALAGALVAAAFVSLPSDAFAQHGYHYRHHDGYGYPYGYYGHGYGGHGPSGYGAYRPAYGSIRIEVSPQALRDEAQVYVNEAHVGVVDDFDGFFQRLVLNPGDYEIEVRLDGYETLQAKVFLGSWRHLQDSPSDDTGPRELIRGSASRHIESRGRRQ